MNKKNLVIVVAATLAIAFTLSATGFIGDNISVRSYEKSQAMSGDNACGNGELPLNVLCNDLASEIQGDENTIGLTSSQQGGTIEEPYENLVDKVSMEKSISDQRTQVWNTRTAPILDSHDDGTPTTNDFVEIPGFAMVTPNPGMVD